MTIQENRPIEHWNYFLTLEEDIDRLSRYLQPTQANFAAYSIEMARILMVAAAEIDVVAKQLCRNIDEKSKAENIIHYREEIVAHFPQITDAVVILARFGLTLKPWGQWKSQDRPSWWRAYNDVKHHRHTNFKDANLENCLNAAAGLFVLLLFFYKDLAKEGQLIPDPRLFTAGQPFKVDRLMFGPGTTTYELMPDPQFQSDEIAAPNLRVTEIKAFVPSKHYEISKQFYQDLGFTMASDEEGIAYFHFGDVSFLLQDDCVASFAEDFAMHLLVEDVTAWWNHVQGSGVTSMDGVRMTDMVDQPWRMRDFCLYDPSGVVWRIGQNTD